MSEYAIQVDNVSYTYPYGANALEDVTINIRKNEFVAIIGQNGAGKSTLLKNVTGLIRPTKGRILVNGKDVLNQKIHEIAYDIGFVLQNPDRQLFADTVEKEVSYALVNAGLPEDDVRQRVEKALREVELQDKKGEFPPALSKGDRAKVVIASVIAMDTDVVILDEPTSGQDFKGCYQIMNIARNLHEMGKTIIYVTHAMSLVVEFSQRTIVMMDRKVLMDDKTSEVFKYPDTLAKTHIKLPQVCSLNYKLRKSYDELPESVLTTQQMGDELLKLRHRTTK